jgi:predicted membrane protein
MFTRHEISFVLMIFFLGLFFLTPLSPWFALACLPAIFFIFETTFLSAEKSAKKYQRKLRRNGA